MKEFDIEKFEIEELEIIEAPGTGFWVGLGAGLIVGIALC